MPLPGAGLRRDLRLAWRSLARTPGFALAVAGALGIGLALLTTTAAILNAYSERAFPYPDADRTYHVEYAPLGTPEPRGVSGFDWRSMADVVDLADSSARTRLIATVANSTQELFGVRAGQGVLEALDARVLLGRSLASEDFERGAEDAAILGESLWRSHFGGDSGVIGHTVLAQSAFDTAAPHPVRIIGVMDGEYPRGDVDLVLPLRSPSRTYAVRLREGAPAVLVERRLTDGVRAAARWLPDGWQGVKLVSVQRRYTAAMRPVFLALSLASFLVLVIVCCNVAVLMLLRALRRRTAIAVRIALGAGRMHVFRAVAAESVILCAVALAAALGLAALGLRAIAPALETVLGRPVPNAAAGISIDLRVAAIVALVGVIAAMTLAAVPLLAPWQRRLTETLRRGGRGTGDGDGGAMRALRNGLVVAQLAVSVALTVGGGLAIRSGMHLLRADLGIDTRDVSRVRVALPRREFPDAHAMVAFQDRLLLALGARAGETVAMASFPLLVEPNLIGVEAGDVPDRRVDAGSIAVSNAFFDVVGMRLVAGRGFRDEDRDGTAPVAVISETLARRLFPAMLPLGQPIRTSERQPGAPPQPWRVVVGVVNDVRQTHTDENLSDVYLPLRQTASPFLSVYARTQLPHGPWTASVRQAVWSIAPRVIVGSANPLAADASRQLARPRFLAAVLTAFSLLAALIAVLGNYAVIAYAVQQRERELAIRGALGATPGAIARLVLSQGAIVVGAGIALGVVASAGLGRALGSQLHGVAPFDVAATLLGAAAVGIGALAFVWLPARRAAAASPATVLNEG
jgi:predicted permease